MTPDTLYSAALMVALVASGLSLAMAVAGPVLGARELPRRTLQAALGAWLALLVSIGTHLVWGHTPGTAAALAPLAFLREHSAFVVAAVLPGVAAAISLSRRRAGARDHLPTGE